MRFMIIMKANADSEAGVIPNEKLLSAMMAYNEELVNAGVMLSGEGLLDSSKGARVTFHDGSTNVVNGPFAHATELVAGFWMWNVGSLEEAIDWVKRCPVSEGEAVIEIRQVAESEDFGDEFTPELREREERLRAQATANEQ